MKKVRISREEQKTRHVEQRLKESIDQLMPSVIKKYKTECGKVDEQKRAALEEALKKGLDKSEQHFKNPRKKFPWTDEIR